MKSFLCSIILLFTVVVVTQAQVSGNDSQKQTQSHAGITQPQPKGGMQAFEKFIQANLAYPKAAEEKGIQGVVSVQFVVSKSGKIKSAVVEKGVDPALDQEALRLVLLSEQQLGWVPGKKGSKHADLKQVVPVVFEIEEEIDLDLDIDIYEVPEGEEIQEYVYQEPKKADPNQIFDIVEESTVPQGGMEAFYKTLYANLQYPSEALELRKQGTAYIRFVVDETGAVVSAEAVGGRELGYGLDAEAIRLIKMSKWVPGKQRGRAVKQRMILPVRFTLPKK